MADATKNIIRSLPSKHLVHGTLHTGTAIIYQTARIAPHMPYHSNIAAL